MYIIYYTGVSPTGEPNDYQFGTPSLEVGLNMLNHLVASGWQLANIRLRENGRTTPLPVEAFDGEPVERALALLIMEWKAALSSL